jgi:DNA-binding SARP family transcriptional activator/tetratricopeptide (TPR) repeat protein
LGPLEVESAGRPVRISGRRQQKLLALLLLHADAGVANDWLIDALWDMPPQSATQQIHNAIGSLRRALSDGTTGAAIVTTTTGYRMIVPPDSVDARRFQATVQQARQAEAAGELEQAVVLLTQALDLWRGPALTGLDGRHISGITARLDEERLVAVELLASLRLRLGDSASLTSHLLQLVGDHPLRDSLRSALMLALHSSGRQADALAVYEEGRRLLADDLGLDPSPQLRRVHQEILGAGEPPGITPQVRSGTSEPAAAGAGSDPRQPAPRSGRAARSTLPHRTRDFTGRAEEIATVLAEAGDSGSTLPLCMIDGMGGVGKTALAVHLAHCLARQYPDGQYYIDLHGFSTGVDPLTPDAALDILLEVTGTPAEAIPATLPGKSARWRAELAGKQVVLVLDNAVNVDQVLPLIPATEGVFVLITSRRRLTGLAGAFPLPLDVLPRDDAVALFTQVAGPRPTSIQPGAVATAVDLCGRLPLAIRIAAARLRQRTGWTVDDLVDRLRTYDTRVRFLSTQERSVVAVLALSYRYIEPAQQRVFRLLSLHPGADFDVPAVAALAELDIADAERFLDQLFDDNLVLHDRDDRFRLHDLVRDCAYGLLEEHDDVKTRRQAQHRLLDYYLHAAKVWSRDMAVGAFRFRPTITCRPRYVPPAESDQAGIALLGLEHRNLIVIAQYASTHGWHVHAWQLPCVLQPYLKLQNYAGAGVELFEAALRAARTVGDRAGESAALTGLGLIHRERGPNSRAHSLFEQAIAISRERGDRYVETYQLGDLAVVQALDDRLEKAYETLYIAREMATEPDSSEAYSAIVNNLGTVCRDLGRYAEARRHFEEALVRHQRANAVLPAALALWNVGTLHQLEGDHQTAIDQFESVLRTSRPVHFAMGEGFAAAALCASYRATGRFTLSLEHGRHALTLARRHALRELETDVLNALGEALFSTGDLESAARMFAAARKCAHRYGYRRYAARALEGLAHVTLARGAPAAARRHWQQSLALYSPDLADRLNCHIHLDAADPGAVTCHRCVVASPAQAPLRRTGRGD